jgi:hypothetical protein
MAHARLAVYLERSNPVELNNELREPVDEIKRADRFSWFLFSLTQIKS